MPNTDGIIAAVKNTKLLALNLAAFLTLVMQAAPAQGQSFSAIGRAINFTNPANYCTGGATPEEKEITRVAQTALGPNVNLVHWAVPCKEQGEFRTGKRLYFDHWLQIHVLGAKGEFKPVTEPRERFLASLSKIQPKLNMAEMNKRISQAMRDQAVRLDDSGVEPIGRDGNAAYFTTRTKLTTSEVTRQMRGIAGVTLINSVPMMVVAYDASENYKDGYQSQTAMRAVLQSLLTGN
jgi:hypothetical protein